MNHQVLFSVSDNLLNEMTVSHLEGVQEICLKSV